MDPDLVAAVEAHQFEAVAAAQWRNGALDFYSLGALMRSLAEPAPREGLKASEEALDERALRALASDPEVRERCADRSALLRLWDACQTPDFRKTTPDEHIRLVRMMFDHLSLGRRRIPDDWMAEQHRQLDRLHGEIDALSTRLASVRTLAYVANRPDWLQDAAHWREVTRNLEERLSDTLHEKLMARFIDRRTSALMRGLGRSDDLLAGVSPDGLVTVEGHFVGRLRGLFFEQAKGEGVLEGKALRATAQRAVGPEMARRLGQVAAEGDEAFLLDPEGNVLWRGEGAGVLANDQPFNPMVRLLGELGPAPARERAARRLEAFVAAEASRRLWALKGLMDAIASGALKGLARGIAYRLVEAGGVLDRRAVEADLSAISRAERRTLRVLGVRIGEFSLFLPSQLEPPGRAVALAFARRADPDWQGEAGGVVRLPSPLPSPKALGLRGLIGLGTLAVQAEEAERLADLLRAHGPRLNPAVLGPLGWTDAEAAEVMRALGFTPLRREGGPEKTLWRRRRPRPAEPTGPRTTQSPFAALASLQPTGAAPTPAKRRRSRRRPAGGRPARV
jgi:ATP-dependent RNA helicase SUPV3L1/SUV3